MCSIEDCTTREEMDEYGESDVTVVSGIRRVKGNIDVSNVRCSTRENDVVQVVGWRAEAQILTDKFKPDFFYTINGCSKKKSDRYGELQCGYEFALHSASEILEVGQVNRNEEAEVISLHDALNIPGRIQVSAYVQTLPFELRGLYHFAVCEGLYRVSVRSAKALKDVTRGQRITLEGKFVGKILEADNMVVEEEILDKEDPIIRNFRSPGRRAHD